MIFILAFCIPILFLFLYIVFFSFEIAASLQSSHPNFFKTNFSPAPVWELTNVFLIFALVSAMGFFPNAIATWAPQIALPMFAFLVIQAIRVCAMMIVFYGKNPSPRTKEILLGSSILAPAFLIGAVAPAFLIGASFFSPQGFTIGILFALIAAIVCIVTAVLFLESRSKKMPHAKKIFWLWMVIIVIIFGIFVAHAFPGIQSIGQMIADQNTVEILLCVCAVGILVSIPGIILLYSFFL